MRRADYAEPTMELIESKSHWDGDCLVWDGGKAHNAPYMSLHRKSISVRRWIAEAVLGKKTKGLFVTFKCNCPMCVNPDHVVVVTRAVLQKMHSDRTQYGKSLTRAKKLSDARRAISNKTMEDVQRVRSWTGSQRELARQMGVSFDWVNKVYRGEIWKDYSNPFAGLIR